MKIGNQIRWKEWETPNVVLGTVISHDTEMVCYKGYPDGLIYFVNHSAVRVIR